MNATDKQKAEWLILEKNGGKGLFKLREARGKIFWKKIISKFTNTHYDEKVKRYESISIYVTLN